MSKPYIVGPKNYTDDWYELRILDEGRNPPFVCGASEAGAIAGVDKYRTRYQVYMVKRGLIDDDAEESEYAYWGKVHESGILDRYEQDTGNHVVRPDHLYMCEELPFIAASPDGMVGSDVCVEAKTASSRMYDKDNCRQRDCFGPDEDDVPSSYLMQAHQQMFVMGAERCDMPVLFDGNRIQFYTIWRNDDVIHNLVNILKKFYQDVIDQKCPDPDWSHPTTIALLKNVYGVDPGVSIDLPPDLTQAYEEYVQAKAEIGRYTRMKEQAQARLLHAMEDAHVGRIPGTNREMVRTYIEQKYWTPKDVEHARKMLGQVKRAGYVRVTDRKAKS